MPTYSNDFNNPIRNSDPIGSISTCLASKFVKPLFDFYNENNYETYLKCLAEILTWSQEFYDLCYNNEKEWETAGAIKSTIYNNGVHRNDFLLAWGDKRIKEFLASHSAEIEYPDMEQYTNTYANQTTDFSAGITMETDRKKIISDGEKVDA